MGDHFGTQWVRALALGAALLLLPAAARAVPPASFMQIQQTVTDFQGGTRPDVKTGSCTSKAPTQLRCSTGNSPLPVTSGWDIEMGCFVVFNTGEFWAGFHQGGIAGDGDGDGNPNLGSFQFDAQGINIREFYDAQLFISSMTLPDFFFSVGDGINVDGFTLAGLGPANGNLCSVGLGHVEPCLASGNATGGSVVGSYQAGTSAPDDVLMDVNTADSSLLCRGGPCNGLADQKKYNLHLFSGSQLDTCEEDLVTFAISTPSIDLEKQASGSCQQVSGVPTFLFGSTYTVVNDGSVDFDQVVLEDHPSAKDQSNNSVALGGPTCTANGSPLSVTGLGGGAFRANLGALAAPPLSTLDCSTGACPTINVQCKWNPIPESGGALGSFVDLTNAATVAGQVNGAAVAHGQSSSSARAILDQSCQPPPTMRKEHEGVGFDNQLNLAGTLPFGSGTAFGSNVDPSGTPDVSSREGFTAQGALAVIGKPGVYSNLPRIPPAAGADAEPGLPALFTWRMLVTGDADDVAPLDVACSLCAELAWRDDHSPAETFVPLEVLDDDLVIENEPVTMKVTHECGPIHTELPCGGTLEGITIPALRRVPTGFPGGALEFLGCKPKVIQLDPVSSGSLILPGDIIQVQILVPGSEQARVFADATSCEAAYLTLTPKGR